MRLFPGSVAFGVFLFFIQSFIIYICTYSQSVCNVWEVDIVFAKGSPVVVISGWGKEGWDREQLPLLEYITCGCLGGGCNFHLPHPLARIYPICRGIISRVRRVRPSDGCVIP